MLCVIPAFPSQLQVVTYKVSYSNNDWDEFSWAMNALDSVNKIFTPCLNKLFNFKKTVRCLWHTLYYIFWIKTEIEYIPLNIKYATSIFHCHAYLHQSSIQCFEKLVLIYTILLLGIIFRHFQLYASWVVVK
jgi:hypothetical protein